MNLKKQQDKVKVSIRADIMIVTLWDQENRNTTMKKIQNKAMERR